MKPEERAEQVTRWLPRVGVSGASLVDLRAEIAAAIREAVAEEREACAALCEESTAHCSVPDDLAAAIRARKEP